MRKLIVFALLATAATSAVAQRPGREDGSGRWQERAAQRQSEGGSRPMRVEQAPPVQRVDAPAPQADVQAQVRAEGWRGRGADQQRGIRPGGQGGGFDPAAMERWQQRRAQQQGAVVPNGTGAYGDRRDQNAGRAGAIAREGYAGGAYDRRRDDGSRRPQWNGSQYGGYRGQQYGGQQYGGQQYGGNWNRGDRGGQRWSNDWRRDPRYDWQRYRQQNRSAFRLGAFYDPFGYGYRPLSIGFTLFSGYYQPNYWLNDPYEYRLPPVYGPYRWVRYYDDAVLVDIYSGEVVDVLRNFFW